MSFALMIGTVLTFVAGFQLFILTDYTEDWFAWTIGAGSAATVIGAFYWTACVLSFLSWRQDAWVRARVGVPGVTVFLWATLITTLVHLDKFHFSSASGTGTVAAWAWVVIYVVDPILVTAALIIQRQIRGEDPERAKPLPRWYVAALSAAGAAFSLLGTLMLWAPDALLGDGPFPLTALTSRTIGGWVLAMGIVFATMAWENDRDRIRPAAVASVVAPALFVIGLVRYRDEFTGGVASWAYVAALAVIAALGVFGLVDRRAGTAPGAGSSTRA